MLEHLIETFGHNQPFAVSEITYKDYSQIWIYKAVAELCEKGKIVHLDRGVYYIPENNKFGVVPFNPMTVIEKRYLQEREKVIGYYAGKYLLYKLGISNLNPKTVEIYSNNETQRIKVIIVGNKRLLLHSARTDITKYNAGVLSFLELMNGIDVEDLDEYKKKQLADYINEHHITKRKITEYIKYFPNKTCRNLIESEVIYSVKL